MPEDFDVINEIMEEFQRETEELDRESERNQRCIKEAEIYIKGLVDSETDDYKVFSPRKAEIIHKKELEKAREKIAFCEEENKRIGRRRELLARYMKKLEGTLRHLNQNLEMQAREAESLRKESIEKLDSLAEKIDLVGSCIEKKPVQAKQDIAVIGKYLREISYRMRNTVWLTRE